MNLLDILRVSRIEQYADGRQDVSRADLFFGNAVATPTIDDFMHIMILIDDDHRHEAFTCVR